MLVQRLRVPGDPWWIPDGTVSSKNWGEARMPAGLYFS